MTLEDLIEALNRYIDEKRKAILPYRLSHLVLQRIVEPHPTFKSYKKYTLILWVVYDDKSKYRVLTLQHQYNTKDFPSEEYQEALIRDIESKFITKLLSLVIDDRSLNNDRTILEDIIYGEYTNYCNE